MATRHRTGTARKRAERIGKFRANSSKATVGCDLQLTVLEVARNLIPTSKRGAAILAGTVLRIHLAQLTLKNGLNRQSEMSSCRELADQLKAANKITLPVWAQVTWLAEIHERYLHSEAGSAANNQVNDLIEGTRWLVMNV